MGRAAPFFLRNRTDTFSVFLYTSRELKFRRMLKRIGNEAESVDLVDSIDEDRRKFVKHQYGHDWHARKQARRESLSQSVQADEQALELSTQLYNNGLMDFLRALDSGRSLYMAQDALVQSDQTVSFNLVQLYKALGGGWQYDIHSAPSIAGSR